MGAPILPSPPLITAGLLRAFLTDSVPDETAIVVERTSDAGVESSAVTAVAFAMTGEGAFSLVLRTISEPASVGLIP